MVDMTMTSRAVAARLAPRRAIGPIGIAARIAVGVGFLALGLLTQDPDWFDVVLGLVVFPAVATVLLGWRARRNPARLDATSPAAHCINVVAFLPLFFIPWTAAGAFLFYGASMLVAAARRVGGCEVTAIANVVLDRDDQVGCVLFGPIDAAEAARS